MTEQDDRRTIIDSRYKVKDDCIHDMDVVDKEIKDLHKKIDEELPKKFATNDKVKPFIALAYITTVAVVSGLIGLFFTLLVGKK